MASEFDQGPKTIWLEVEGLRVRCLTAGASGSPVLLLLHGGGIDSAGFSYKYAIEPLARSHRVFAPDWPGYGESDKPDVEHTIEFYAAFLGGLMDALQLQRASLVGLSLGGGAVLGNYILRSPICGIIGAWKALQIGQKLSSKPSVISPIWTWLRSTWPKPAGRTVPYVLHAGWWTRSTTI